MKIKFFGLCALLLLITVSCKKDLNGLVETQPRYSDPGDGGLDVLGYGYDIINGKFATAESATRRVIDVRKLKTVHEGRILESQGTFVNFPMVSGESYDKFVRSHKLNIDIQSGIKIFGLKLFGSDFKSSFDDSTIRESTRSFARVDMMVKTSTLEVKDHNLSFSYLKDFLDPDFIDACNKLTPEELIKVYGIGVIKKMDVGGKLSLEYSSIVSSGDKNLAVSAGGNAAFKFLFNVDVKGNYTYTQQDVNRNTNQKLVYKSMGGTGAIGVTPGNLTQPSTFNPNTWSQTVVRKNSVLINFYDDSFILLHELIPNQQKANLVRDLIYQKLGLITFVKGKNGKVLAKIWGNPDMDNYAFTSFEFTGGSGSDSHNFMDYIMAHNVILNRGGTTYDNEFSYNGYDSYHFNNFEAPRTLGVVSKNLNRNINYKVSYKYSSYNNIPIPNANSYQIKQLPETAWTDGKIWYQANKTITGVNSFEECCFVGKHVDDYVVYPEGSKVELYIYDLNRTSIIDTLVFE